MLQVNCPRKVAMVAAACALTASLCGLAACSSSGASASDQTLDARVAKAQASHAGRYEVSGSHGCFGCHGANAGAWPILDTAPQLPAFHFDTDAPTSFEDLGERYTDCAACHIEITGEQETSAGSQS